MFRADITEDAARAYVQRYVLAINDVAEWAHAVNRVADLRNRGYDWRGVALWVYDTRAAYRQRRRDALGRRLAIRQAWSASSETRRKYGPSLVDYCDADMRAAHVLRVYVSKLRDRIGAIQARMGYAPTRDDCEAIACLRNSLYHAQNAALKYGPVQ
jgi:hypothetical protein